MSQARYRPLGVLPSHVLDIFGLSRLEDCDSHWALQPVELNSTAQEPLPVVQLGMGSAHLYDIYSLRNPRRDSLGEKIYFGLQT